MNTYYVEVLIKVCVGFYLTKKYIVKSNDEGKARDRLDRYFGNLDEYFGGYDSVKYVKIEKIDDLFELED